MGFTSASDAPATSASRIGLTSSSAYSTSSIAIARASPLPFFVGFQPVASAIFTMVAPVTGVPMPCPKLFHFCSVARSSNGTPHDLSQSPNVS